MKFHKFTGQPEDFEVFERDAATIIALYPTAEQQILQIASICGEPINKLV